MLVDDVNGRIGDYLYKKLKDRIESFRPAQEKSIHAGLLERKNLLVCTPTASGKTLIAEIAMIESIVEDGKKAVYVVPLKALASEKYRDFKKRYPELKVALSIGDVDAADHYLEGKDIIITVSEKLDSLIRHKSPWIRHVNCVIIDEIHLLNDSGRGPTLEIVLTILMRILKKAQFIGLSATIGNPEELAKWLKAELVMDDWRPVELKQGVYRDEEITFY